MAINATNVKLASVAGIAVGDDLTIDTSGTVETRTVTIVGTAGSGGTGVTVSEAYKAAHTSGHAVNVFYWGPWSWVRRRLSAPPTAPDGGAG